ncbi:hypothetical protein DL98DRAFT_590023 [Cadophora sp. DSE1049]|nr:hypothetical protein DL98DRAFT_590023 [Cadophora sp. DSE1049]
MSFGQVNRRDVFSAESSSLLQHGTKSKVTSLFTPQPVVTILISIPHGNQFDRNLIDDQSTTQKFIVHNQFVEGQTQSMTFDDINPAVFGSFVHWLYHQQVATDVGIEMIPEFLAEFWIMAERFLIPKLQNQVMDKLFQSLDSYAIICSVEPTAKIIQDSKSEVLKSMLLNRVSISSGNIRNAWSDVLSLDVLKRFVKGDYIQGPNVGSASYHVDVDESLGKDTPYKEGDSPTSISTQQTPPMSPVYLIESDVGNDEEYFASRRKKLPPRPNKVRRRFVRAEIGHKHVFNQ